MLEKLSLRCLGEKRKKVWNMKSYVRFSGLRSAYITRRSNTQCIHSAKTRYSFSISTPTSNFTVQTSLYFFILFLYTYIFFSFMAIFRSDKNITFLCYRVKRCKIHFTYLLYLWFFHLSLQWTYQMRHHKGKTWAQLCMEYFTARIREPVWLCYRWRIYVKKKSIQNE